jgi:hypothetical protein
MSIVVIIREVMRGFLLWNIMLILVVSAFGIAGVWTESTHTFILGLFYGTYVGYNVADLRGKLRALPPQEAPAP